MVSEQISALNLYVVPEMFLANPDEPVAVLAKLVTLLAGGGLVELLVESGGAGKSLLEATRLI